MSRAFQGSQTANRLDGRQNILPALTANRVPSCPLQGLRSGCAPRGFRAHPIRARRSLQHPSPHTYDTRLSQDGDHRCAAALRRVRLASRALRAAAPRPSPRAIGERDHLSRASARCASNETRPPPRTPIAIETPTATHALTSHRAYPTRSFRRLTQKSRTVRPRGVAAKARASVRVGAVAEATRPVWCPGTPPPAHLDGTLPCDYGFDPLNLGADPENLKWFVQAELMHCRWAMLGLAGMVGPELTTKIGMTDLPNWIEAGNWDGYWLGAGPLLFVQFAMMNWAEVRRWEDMKNPGTMNEDPLTGANKGDTNTDVGYPKGLFDPMGYAKDPKKAEELKRKEIANGRLAMVAIAGCFAQAITTGKGPVDNLFYHLADPGHHNIFS
jgi:hypothetical protein